MKKTKKLLALALSATVVAGTAIATMAMPASAADTASTYKFNAEDYNYGWGEWAKDVTYTDTGYVILKDQDRFCRQYVAHYDLSESDGRSLAKLIQKGVESDDEAVKVKALNDTCQNTDFTGIGVDEDGNISKTQSYEINILTQFKWKTIDEDDGYAHDDDGYSYDSVENKNWIGNGGKEMDLVFACFDEYDISTLVVSAIEYHVMNYTCNAVTNVDSEWNGKAGLGFVEAGLSPYYLPGEEAPEIGNNTGKGVEFIPNETDPTAAGVFVFGDKKYAQYTEDDEEAGAPKGAYGNGYGCNKSKRIVDGVVYGDVDESGDADSTDVLLMNQHIADIKLPTFNEKNADINGDGSVQTDDVLILTQHLAGIKVSPWE